MALFTKSIAAETCSAGLHKPIACAYCLTVADVVLPLRLPAGTRKSMTNPTKFTIVGSVIGLVLGILIASVTQGNRAAQQVPVTIDADCRQSPMAVVSIHAGDTISFQSPTTTTPVPPVLFTVSFHDPDLVSTGSPFPDPSNPTNWKKTFSSGETTQPAELNFVEGLFGWKFYYESVTVDGRPCSSSPVQGMGVHVTH